MSRSLKQYFTPFCFRCENRSRRTEAIDILGGSGRLVVKRSSASRELYCCHLAAMIFCMLPVLRPVFRSLDACLPSAFCEATLSFAQVSLFVVDRSQRSCVCAKTLLLLIAQSPAATCFLPDFSSSVCTKYAGKYRTPGLSFFFFSCCA